MMLDTIHLETRARTSGGYEYDVIVRKGKMGWILAILDTSGSWYVESLDDCIEDRLAIDWGQGWYLENLQPILKEARRAIYRNV